MDRPGGLAPPPPPPPLPREGPAGASAVARAAAGRTPAPRPPPSAGGQVGGVPHAFWPARAGAANILSAELLIHGGGSPSGGSRGGRATDIRGGAGPADRLGGNKVRSFYECL